MQTVNFAAMEATSHELLGAELHAQQPLINCVVAAATLLDPQGTQGEDGAAFLVRLTVEGAHQFYAVALATQQEVPMQLGAWGQHGSQQWAEQPWGSDLPAGSLLATLVTQGEWALPLFTQAE